MWSDDQVNAAKDYSDRLGAEPPSPGYVARGGVRGPLMETCPHCYRQILAICLAAHLAAHNKK